MSNLREGLLLGCGNPLLDISAVVSENLLKKYNLDRDNAILAGDEHKDLYREIIENYKAEYIAGGSVQNSLRVAQWILQKPNVAVFFGAVGRDEYSKILADKAQGDGVNVKYQFIDTEPTGRCAVLITGTHRSLCADLGAANHFTPAHLEKPENRDILKDAQFFYISGFFLTVSPPTIMEVAKHAFSVNLPFLMNLSAPFISQYFKVPLLAALPYVDILFGNETETVAFANEQQWETTDLREIGHKICQLPKENTKRSRVAVITQGSSPVLLVRDGEVEEFQVDKLEAKDVVDTNGAGDAFVGGFLAQFIKNKPYGVCIRSGIWAASQIIQRSGCTFDGVPDFKE